MKKRTAAIFLALALVLGAGVGAVAAANSEVISATLNRATKVIYNGVEQSFTDASGNPVYPIAYNGSVYLPVRAAANMVGIQNSDIKYDGATNTVTLGKTEKPPAALTTLKNSGANKYSWVINDKAELSIEGSDATQTYQTGIQWDIWNGSASTAKERVLNFEVSGYSEVIFTAWSDVEATVKLYDQNYNVITSFTVKANALTAKTISIPAGTTALAFGADGPLGKNGTLKILDPTVK